MNASAIPAAAISEAGSTLTRKAPSARTSERIAVADELSGEHQ